jgi:hypothetical protein
LLGVVKSDAAVAALAFLPSGGSFAQLAGMSTLTKARAKKLARPVRKSATSGKRLAFRPDLPPITPESPLYGADDLVGCVTIGLAVRQGVAPETYPRPYPCR